MTREGNKIKDKIKLERRILKVILGISFILFLYFSINKEWNIVIIFSGPMIASILVLGWVEWYCRRLK